MTGTTHESPLIWNEELPSSRMAGADFVLPWLIDRFTGTLKLLRENFTRAEACLIVELHEHASSSNPLRQALFTHARIKDAIARSRIEGSADIDPDAMLAKFSTFDEQQLALLRIWAAAYWEDSSIRGMSIARYVAF